VRAPARGLRGACCGDGKGETARETAGEGIGEDGAEGRGTGEAGIPWPVQEAGTATLGGGVEPITPFRIGDMALAPAAPTTWLISECGRILSAGGVIAWETCCPLTAALVEAKLCPEALCCASSSWPAIPASGRLGTKALLDLEAIMPPAAAEGSMDTRSPAVVAGAGRATNRWDHGPCGSTTEMTGEV